MRWTRPPLAFLGLASLCLLGCSNPETPQQSPQHTSPAPRKDTHAVVRHVRSMVLAPTTLPDTITAVGTIHTRQRSEVSSRLVARVLAVHVQVGDRVKAGQLLFSLDDVELQA